jgi:hypothetical protein
MVSSLRWSEEDWAELEAERAVDEAERVRAAEAMADYKFMQNVELYNEALNVPPVRLESAWGFYRNDWLTARGTSGVQKLLREFWKERV